MGRPSLPVEQRKVTTAFSLDPSVVEGIKEQAELQDRSASSLTNKILRNFLDDIALGRGA